MRVVDGGEVDLVLGDQAVGLGARPLEDAVGLTPPVLHDRLAVGENTGNVVPSLKQIANAYQKLISSQLSMFTKVIASAVLMGVFILGEPFNMWIVGGTVLVLSGVFWVTWAPKV